MNRLFLSWCSFRFENIRIYYVCMCVALSKIWRKRILSRFQFFSFSLSLLKKGQTVIFWWNFYITMVCNQAIKMIYMNEKMNFKLYHRYTSNEWMLKNKNFNSWFWQLKVRKVSNAIRERKVLHQTKKIWFYKWFHFWKSRQNYDKSSCIAEWRKEIATRFQYTSTF